MQHVRLASIGRHWHILRFLGAGPIVLLCCEQWPRHRTAASQRLSAASQRFIPTMHTSLPGLGQRTSLVHSNADLRLPRVAGSTSALQRASVAHHLKHLVSWWDAGLAPWQATSGKPSDSCSATSVSSHLGLQASGVCAASGRDDALRSMQEMRQGVSARLAEHEQELKSGSGPASRRHPGCSVRLLLEAPRLQCQVAVTAHVGHQRHLAGDTSSCCLHHQIALLGISQVLARHAVARLPATALCCLQRCAPSCGCTTCCRSMCNLSPFGLAVRAHCVHVKAVLCACPASICQAAGLRPSFWVSWFHIWAALKLSGCMQSVPVGTLCAAVRMVPKQMLCAGQCRACLILQCPRIRFTTLRCTAAAYQYLA